MNEEEVRTPAILKQGPSSHLVIPKSHIRQALGSETSSFARNSTQSRQLSPQKLIAAQILEIDQSYGFNN